MQGCHLKKNPSSGLRPPSPLTKGEGTFSQSIDFIPTRRECEFFSQRSIHRPILEKRPHRIAQDRRLMAKTTKRSSSKCPVLKKSQPRSVSEGSSYCAKSLTDVSGWDFDGRKHPDVIPGLPFGVVRFPATTDTSLARLMTKRSGSGTLSPASACKSCGPAVWETLPPFGLIPMATN